MRLVLRVQRLFKVVFFGFAGEGFLLVHFMHIWQLKTLPQIRHDLHMRVPPRTMVIVQEKLPPACDRLRILQDRGVLSITVLALHLSRCFAVFYYFEAMVRWHGAVAHVAELVLDHFIEHFFALQPDVFDAVEFFLVLYVVDVLGEHTGVNLGHLLGDTLVVSEDLIEVVLFHAFLQVLQL